MMTTSAYREIEREKRESHKSNTLLEIVEPDQTHTESGKHRKVLDGESKVAMCTDICNAFIVKHLSNPDEKHGSNICYVIRETAFLEIRIVSSNYEFLLFCKNR